ncbi:MAG: hypothetical protein GEV11_27500 [Streptosporangiales bacterium]|nr:hypothetical protein [Streptosporangiales bacterium]
MRCQNRRRGDFSWTMYSKTMYSNLVTAGGATNHLLIPRTLPLVDAQRHLVTIVAPMAADRG